MALFLLKRHEWDYDQTGEIAVLAADETGARQLAADTQIGLRDDHETAADFLDPARSTCEMIHTAAQAPRVILESFHAG
jgi:hypothetical protein